MPYPHIENGQKLLSSGHFYQHSPFEVPVEVVQNGLVWLLSDPGFQPLKTLIRDEFSSVDTLRLELVSGSIKLSSVAIDQVLGEIDRLVDDYRKGVALS
ncbi:hypothetical protein [Endozoicomonas sp.]|uniref:hypothetical protein n=1 Tax=Endozoicomonas sp. TaxID=1892382 RepID=UPI002885E815|nr:hypothetical protein [Endozoicomonas sp.]